MAVTAVRLATPNGVIFNRGAPTLDNLLLATIGDPERPRAEEFLKTGVTQIKIGDQSIPCASMGMIESRPVPAETKKKVKFRSKAAQGRVTHNMNLGRDVFSGQIVPNNSLVGASASIFNSYQITPSAAVWFLFDGEIDRVMDILASLRGVGTRRGAGHGRVLDPTSHATSLGSAILLNGRALRPLPCQMEGIDEESNTLAERNLLAPGWSNDGLCPTWLTDPMPTGDDAEFFRMFGIE